MCKMSPIERERMMKVLRISFPEFFDSNPKRS
nr:MAG TPA: Transcriptional repressor p66-alpha, Methyl-CpG-binding domain methylation, coiled-coil, NuRD, MBD2 [Caudoviricetes sp.]